RCSLPRRCFLRGRLLDRRLLGGGCLLGGRLGGRRLLGGDLLGGDLLGGGCLLGGDLLGRCARRRRRHVGRGRHVDRLRQRRQVVRWCRDVVRRLAGLLSAIPLGVAQVASSFEGLAEPC